MYLPPHFAEDNPEVLHALIDQIGAATLISAVEGDMTANLEFRNGAGPWSAGDSRQ